MFFRLGDRRFGGPGTRVQTFVEDAFAFHLYADPLGTSRFAHAAQARLAIAAGPPERLVVHGPRVVRTGRAAPSMFNKIMIDYYGAYTPVPQMASITIPEARMAVIKPYDMGQLPAIEKAIRDSDLGVNPTNDGQILRVVFPQLTEERRRDLVKQARAKGEDAKVAIRNIRRRSKEELDRLVKDGESGEDDVRRAEKELDDLTAQHTHSIDDAVKNKETELLEV